MTQSQRTTGLVALDDVVAPMIGLPTWYIRQGYGSFLTLEFGQPSLVVKEWTTERGVRRVARPEGQWMVWLYCCEWSISSHAERIAWSESARDEIAGAAAVLNGQKLLLVSVEPSKGRSRFEFDLGGLIEAWPVGDDQTEEQWFIHAPGTVFGYRADGQIVVQPQDTPRSQAQWRKGD